MHPPDIEGEECDDNFLMVVSAAASGVVLCAIILVALCCLLAYCKKKNTEAQVREKELKSKRDIKTQEANDKTMAVITKLLNTMYSQVDMVPEDRMNQFMEIISYYNSVINEIFMLQTNALRDIQQRYRNIRADGEDTESDDGTDGRFTYTCIYIVG